MTYNTESLKEVLKEKLKNGILSFSTLALIWLCLILIFRFLEILIYSINHVLPLNYFELIYKSFFIDIVFCLKYVFPLSIIYLIIHFLSTKLAKLLYSVLIVIFLTNQILLVNYYNTSLNLLGADLFNYSLEDIKITIGASGKVNIGSIVGLLCLLSLVIFVLFKLNAKHISNLYLAIAIPVISLMIIMFSSKSFLGQTNIESEFAQAIITNKSNHFYKEVYNYKYVDSYDDEVDIYSENYLNTNLEINNKDFPFLHVSSNSDVLTPFFSPKSTKPDIVIIVVEGLGRAFSNEEAYLGSFTPFLDSLSKKSMYWKNFLSAGGRTFAVLPTIIGSLPFAENGFLELEERMPKHISLINLLQYNNYRTSFYYGGDSKFDHMRSFLKFNSIDVVVDENDFPKNKMKLPEMNGFSWGYGDFELYDYFLETKIEDTTAQPDLSILLTVSTHNPFLINEQKKYENEFEKRMNDLAFTKKEKKAHRNYAKQYSTILYADDALRSFFNNYSKRKDYNNTIFVITGDHRIPEIPLSTKIDRYHVPLIIYSPLLKRTANIASVSSHFDITPSLVHYLKTNHNIKSPSTEAWLGRGLDTTAIFQNIRSIPLMQTKTLLIDFVMDGYHLNGNTLFKLNENLGEYIVEDSVIKKRLEFNFKQFKIKNTDLNINRKLIPDSLVNAYTRH